MTLESDPPDLVVRPAAAVTADEVAALKRLKAEVLALLAPSPVLAPAETMASLIAEYKHILGRLWSLNIPPAAREVGAVGGRCHVRNRLLDQLSQPVVGRLLGDLAGAAAPSLRGVAVGSTLVNDIWHLGSSWPMTRRVSWSAGCPAMNGEKSHD